MISLEDEVMRIGILTFHRAINYGAVLQAYALEQILCQLGHDCEIIDYRNLTIENTFKVFPTKEIHSVRNFVSAFLKCRMRYQKQKWFRAFICDKCEVSESVLKSEELSMLAKKYDVLIVGSDQVWNFKLTGEDYAYFFENLDGNTRKIAYAASISEEVISAQQSERIKRDLENFSAVSMREDEGKAWLESIGVDKNIEVVLDPTLLLTSEEWNFVITHDRISNIPEHYLLVYFVNPEKKYYDDALKTARTLGLKAVLISDFFHLPYRGFVNIQDASPEQFVWLFKNADFVLTDSFHGTAFSVDFQVDFAYMLNQREKGKNNRIMTLIHALGLEERAYDLKPFGSVDNWDDVQMKLSALRQKSMRFLAKIGTDS